MNKETDKTKFVKEPEEDTREFILQKNKKTKLGATILIAFLVLLIVGIIVSNVFFNN